MRATSKTRRIRVHAPTRVAGISLVEVMVGLVIGLIATVIILQTFQVSEGYKRGTTSAGDAQQNGLFSTFMVSQELANAGNGLASASEFLVNCPNTGNMDNMMKPIPALIAPGGSMNAPDSIVVHYSTSDRLVYPAIIQASNAPSFVVKSPTGFKAGDMVIMVRGAAFNAANARCERRQVNNVSAPDATTGFVTVTLTDMPTDTYNPGDYILPLGPWARVRRVQFDVVDAGGGDCLSTSTNCVLRMRDLTPVTTAPGAAVPAPEPIASNIVVMKMQYGIDPDNDGTLQWVIPGTTPGWAPNDVMAADWVKLSSIKAVRIGLVIRSAQYDREIKTYYASTGGAYNWTLFDCPAHDVATCASATGTIPVDTNGGGYHYRVYEAVVPLRNQLWNR